MQRIKKFVTVVVVVAVVVVVFLIYFLVLEITIWFFVTVKVGALERR